MALWEYTETELWRHGEGEIALYHVFGLCSFGQTVLAFAEARYGLAKDACERHDIVLRRSTDGGRSFAPSVTLLSGGSCYANPVPVHDAVTGKTFLFYCENPDNCNTECFVMESADGGVSWSRPRRLTDTLGAETAPYAFHLFGPGHGVQLRGGRLIVPVWHSPPIELRPEERGYCVSLLLSDDHGASWRQAAPFTGKVCRANESRVAQTADGSLLWSFRPARMTSRFCSRSTDGGETWTEPVPLPVGPAVCCDAGLVSLAGKSGYEDLVVLSRPSRLDRREDTELLWSLDGGRTFTGRMALPAGEDGPGYSDLTVLREEEPILGLLHCRSNHVLFSRVSLQTLTAGGYEGTKRAVRL